MTKDRHMKKLLTITALTATVLTGLNAGDKFANLSQDYLDTSASVNVKKVIAQDTQTSKKTLEILSHDYNKEVREYAKKNLK